MFYQRTNQKLKRYVERLLGSGYPRTRNYTNDLSWGHIYYEYIMKYQNYFLRNYMKEFVETIGGRSIAYRAITQGYWWSNMQKEALEYTKKCDQCQRFAPNTHQLRGFLNPLSNP